MASSTPGAHLLIESRMQDALLGDPGACFDIGIALSCGERGRVNRVEAHKWFTLAVKAGHRAAVQSCASIAREMTARELAAAQRLSRIALSPHGQQMARLSASLFA